MAYSSGPRRFVIGARICFVCAGSRRVTPTTVVRIIIVFFVGQPMGRPAFVKQISLYSSAASI